eukprot:5760755-Pleurochrysis_carterae.AAC.1
MIIRSLIQLLSGLRLDNGAFVSDTVTLQPSNCYSAAWLERLAFRLCAWSDQSRQPSAKCFFHGAAPTMPVTERLGCHDYNQLIYMIVPRFAYALPLESSILLRAYTQLELIEEVGCRLPRNLPRRSAHGQVLNYSSYKLHAYH